MTSSFQGITDLKVKFRLEGFERLQGLGKQLVKIQGIAGKTDKDFLKLFADIKRFAAASATTEGSIRGQIGALTRLGQNLDVTGSAYSRVVNEIKQLNLQLDLYRNKNEKTFSSKQLRQTLGASTDTFAASMRRIMLDNPLEKATVGSVEYAKKLRNQTLAQELFNNRLAQTEAIARRMVAMRETLGTDKKPPRPLDPDLDTGYEFFKEKMDPFTEDSAATSWDRARTRSGYQTRIDIYEQQLQNMTIGSQQEKDLLEKIKTTRAEFDKLLGGESALYKRIGTLGATSATLKDGAMGKPFSQVVKDIEQASRTGGKSITALTRQRDLWMELRNSINVTHPQFINVTKRLNEVEKSLNRVTRSGGRFQGTLSAMGGLLTAGLFGGPAGLVGGLGALGVGRMRGLEGPALAATIGSAGLITSQIARPIAQGIGGSATYAADITKSQIALRTATEVKDAEGRVLATESLRSYEQALKAAAFATDELNIPQEVAAKGMTRLSAAVIGAGGNVNNAAEAFINITAAIKGTGGNAEDVKSAITAMVQIFSKGKVSAEELSGQLGERFPAAVTRFAKANNLSTIELQKGLKAGTVGLDMLSKFVASLGKDFLPVAREIAESTEEAGARGVVAINKLRLEFGKLIQPLGAKFQELGVKILTQLGPPLIAVGKIAGATFLGIANALNFLLDRIGMLTRALALLAAQMVVTNWTAITAAIGTFAGAVVRATMAIKAQTLAMLKNPIFAVGVAGLAAYEYANRFNRLVDDIKDGTAPLSKGRRELEFLEKQLAAVEGQRDKAGNLPDHTVLVPKRDGGMSRRRAGSMGGFGEDDVEKMKAKIERLKEAMLAATEDSSFQLGIKENFQKLTDGIAGEGATLPVATLFESLKNGMVQVQQVFVNAFNTMAQALTNFAMTGKLNFREFALSVIRDLTQMFIKAAILAPLFKMLGITGGGGGFFGLFNKGNPAKGAAAVSSATGSIANTGTGRDGGFGLGTYGAGMPSNPALKSQPGFWDKVGSWTQPFREGVGNIFKGSAAQAATLDEHLVDSFDWKNVTGQEDPYHGPGGGWNPWRDGQPGQFYDYPLGDQSFLGGFGGEIGQIAHGTHPGSEGALRGMFSDASMGDRSAQMNLYRHGYTDFHGPGFGAIYPGDTTPGLEGSLGDFRSGQWGHSSWPTQSPGFTGAGERYGEHLRSNFGPYGEGISGGPKFGARILVGGASLYGAGILSEWLRDQGILPAFAKGGVVNSPTLSLMGEAGSEAVLPLKRGKDGKLGVAAGGGAGSTVVNVEVDAKGTRVQGDENGAGRLGKMIGAAIQAELVKQRRPGGMLSAA